VRGQNKWRDRTCGEGRSEECTARESAMCGHTFGLAVLLT
jgi:hypothetical protein